MIISSVATITPENRPQARFIQTKLAIPSCFGISDSLVWEDHNIEATFNSHSSIFSQGGKFAVSIRVTDISAALSAVMTLTHVCATAHCAFTSPGVSSSTSLLDKLYCSDAVAQCTILITSAVGEYGGESKLGGEAVQYYGILHPTGKSTALLLVTAPAAPLHTDSSSISVRLCSTPTHSLAASTPDAASSLDMALPPQSGAPSISSSSSIGQKNLRRRRSILGASSVLPPPGAAGSSGTLIATSIGGSSHDSSGSTSITRSSITGNGSGAGSSGSGSSSRPRSPPSWIKGSVTCINSPLTSPPRAFASSSLDCAGLGLAPPRPHFSPPPTLSASTSAACLTSCAPAASSSPSSLPEMIKSVSCPSLSTGGTSGSSIARTRRNPCNRSPLNEGVLNTPSSCAFTSLSPYADSGSRSIFPELVMEGATCAARASAKSTILQTESPTEAQTLNYEEDMTMLAYSNMGDDVEKSVVSGVTARARSTPAEGSSMGLFSSVMRGAGLAVSLLPQPMRLGMFSSDNRGCPIKAALVGAEKSVETSAPRLDDCTISASTAAFESGTSVDIVSTLVGNSSECVSAQQQHDTHTTDEAAATTAAAAAVRASTIAASVAHFEHLVSGSKKVSLPSAPLLTLLALCIFMRKLTPMTAARQIITRIYGKRLDKSNLKESEIISKLKKKNNTVASVCALLLLEVNLLRGGGPGAGDAAGPLSSSHDKVLSKSACCVLYVLLFLENESRMRKEYKAFASLSTKPAAKCIARCFARLNACFELKSLASGAASKDALQWLFSSSIVPLAASAASASTSVGTVSVASAPGELFLSDVGSAEVVLQVVTLAQASYSRSSFLRMLVTAHSKVSLASEDSEASSEAGSRPLAAVASTVTDLSIKGGFLDLIRPKPPLKSAEQLSPPKDSLASGAMTGMGVKFLSPPDDFTSSDGSWSGVGLTQTSFIEGMTKAQLQMGGGGPIVKKKNSLVSARVPLNGHRTSMEGRLRSQQQVTSTVPRPKGSSFASMARGAQDYSKGSTISAGGKLPSASGRLISSTEGAGMHSKKQRVQVPLFPSGAGPVRGLSSQLAEEGGSIAMHRRGVFQKQLFRDNSSVAPSKDVPPRPAGVIGRRGSGSSNLSSSGSNSNSDSSGAGHNKRPRPRDFDKVMQDLPMNRKRQAGGADVVADTPARRSATAGTPVRKYPPGRALVVASTPM